MREEIKEAPQDEDARITYTDFGKESAAKANGNPEILPDILNVVYTEIVRQAGEDEEGIAKRIVSLENEILNLESSKQDLITQKLTAEAEVQEFEKQIDEIENEQGSPDFVPFVIGAFITLLLTFYLWSFYSASGYAAFGNLRSDISGFAGVFAALSDAMDEGGFVAVLTILFPTIFLGLGFLIHDALEKKKYFFIFILLLFTFCFDALLGFFIAQKIHTNAFNLGEITLKWDQLSTLEKFSDPVFYFVLASGFVCYVMWGFLLNYTLNQWKEMQPGQRLLKLRKLVIEFNNKIAQLKSETLKIENQIKNRVESINDYRNGKVHIDINALKSYIGHFMSGWAAWTHLMKSKNAEELVAKANHVKDEWLRRKIAALETIAPNLEYSADNSLSAKLTQITNN